LNYLLQYLSWFFLGFFIGGCSSQRAPLSDLTPREDQHIQSMRKQLPKDFSLEQYIALKRKKDWFGAIAYVNGFLHRKVESYPYLHVLSALCYEKIYEESGDNEHYQSYIAALTTAHNLEPKKWFFPYLLACAYCKNQELEKAESFFARSLLLNPKQPMALHGLAYTAYYMEKFPLALSSIEKALEMCPYDRNILRSAVMIYGAVGETEKASSCLAQYEKLEENHVHTPLLKSRLQDWKNVYAQHDHSNISGAVRHILTAGDDGDDAGPGKSSLSASTGSIGNAQGISESADLKVSTPASSGPSKPAEKEHTPRNCVVDCCLVRVSDSNETKKGTNLLSSFLDGISLGGDNLFSLAQTQDYWWPLQSAVGAAPSGLGNTLVRTFGFALTNGGLSYNINIANISTSRIELLSRPTLYVTENIPASFLSGDTITGAVTGSGAGGATFSVDVGYKVDITLISIECVKGKEIATMDIKISGSILNTKPDFKGGVEDQSYEVSRSIVSTRVEVPMEHTVMLGGLYERQDEQQSERVPFLGDIPIIQYLFSTVKTFSETRSIVFFAVPRYQNTIERASKVAWHNLPIPKDLIEDRLSSRGILTRKNLPSIFYIVRNLKNGRFYPTTRNDDLLPVYWGETCLDADDKIRQLASFLIY
jgi:tetratricopeptide (TPR) repeat protein